MTDRTICRAVLRPRDGPAITVPLVPPDHALPEETSAVYQDRLYTLDLQWEDASPVPPVQAFFLNGSPESFQRTDDTLRFSRDGREQPLFADTYSYAVLELQVQTEEDTLSLVSGCIPVLCPEGLQGEHLQKMAQMVWDHRDSPLLDLERAGTGGRSSLMAQLQLAKEIADLYEESYGYLRTQSRYRITKRPVTDWADRLQSVTQDTLRHLMTHPEELEPAPAGISIRGMHYLPRKAVGPASTETRDIYENQVLAAFLRRMAEEMQQLQHRCAELLPQAALEDGDRDYFFSPALLTGHIGMDLPGIQAHLSQLSQRFTRLWIRYRDVFHLAGAPLTAPPRATATFLQVPLYHALYLRIHRWFRFGIFGLEGEERLLSLLRTSQFYEKYCLWQLGVLLEARGLAPGAPQRFCYPSPDKLYQDTDTANTFPYSGGGWTVTLYWQPVLYIPDRNHWDRDDSCNGIYLYRNNTRGLEKAVKGAADGKGGRYYLPDFLLKAQRDGEGGASYLILDAKYSNRPTVLRYHLPELALKYLLSLSAAAPGHKPVGLAILYGKAEQGHAPKPESLFNTIRRDTPPALEALMVPCWEGAPLPQKLLDLLGLPEQR